MFSEASAFWEGCKGPPYMLDTSFNIPLYGGASLKLHPHLFVGFPVHWHIWDYLYVIWGIFPLCWACSPICWGVWGHQHMGCPYAYSCTFLQFIMSHISTMAMITTPPVTVVSSRLSSLSSVTVAPSLMGLPVTLDQHGVTQPPPLMPSGSGGVIGPASVPQQQPPASMPLLAYANYAMGSPQIGFFFRVEPPTVLYIICLVSVLVSAFYF